MKSVESEESVTRLNLVSPELLKERFKNEYDSEYLESISSGLNELIQITSESSPKLKEFIMSEPRIVLAFSGMVPFISMETSEADEQLLNELFIGNTSGNVSINTNENGRRHFFNERALRRLQNENPKLFPFPEDIPVGKFLMENSSFYSNISFPTPIDSTEVYLRDYRFGLLSGFEQESTKILSFLNAYFSNSRKTAIFFKELLEKNAGASEIKEAELTKLTNYNFAKFNKKAVNYLHDWSSCISLFLQSVE